MTLVEQLAARAFLTAAPLDANDAIAEARALHGGDGGESISYELVLPALGPDEFLTGRALQKLVYFLDCRGAKLPRTPGVFVSLFTPGGLLCIDAGAAVEVMAAARGLALEEVVRRYGEAGAGDPPLLGT